MQERRKSTRYHIPFNLEVVRASRNSANIHGEIRDFSSDGFSFASENFACELNETIKMKIKFSREANYAYIMGKIIWKIQMEQECQIGIEINEIDLKSDVRELNYPFIMWTDKIKNI